MARVNINIWRISELKWTTTGEFNSDDHCIYCCGQESLRRDVVALIVQKRVQNAVLGCNLKKERWQEYTEVYEKDLNDPDNYDGMITHLEPDILECEVKGALESITMNKASGGDGIPVELFQIQKDDAVKVLHSICQQIWKTEQWPQDWKRSVFIPIP